MDSPSSPRAAVFAPLLQAPPHLELLEAALMSLEVAETPPASLPTIDDLLAEQGRIAAALAGVEDAVRTLHALLAYTDFGRN